MVTGVSVTEAVRAATLHQGRQEMRAGGVSVTRAAGYRSGAVPWRRQDGRLDCLCYRSDNAAGFTITRSREPNLAHWTT